MEASDVKRRVHDTIERARREAAARRSRADQASLDYARFLETVAVPLFRQVANVLKSEGYPFSVSTPGGMVRLSSDRHADDYLELLLDTTGPEPRVMGRMSRTRGRRTYQSEHPIADVPVDELTDDLLMNFLTRELEPYVEK